MSGPAVVEVTEDTVVVQVETGAPSANYLRGRALSTTPPSNGQVLQWNASSSQWEPVAPDSLITGGFVNTTGDTMTGSLVINAGGLTVSGGSVAVSVPAAFTDTTGVTTDVVTEHTVDAGVTVDGVLLKDGVVTGSLAGRLATARTIGGVSFDGSANITVATATGGFTVTGNLTATGQLGVASGSRVYLDGVTVAGDSYMVESSANVVDVVAGGVTTLRTTTTGVSVTGTAGVTGLLTASGGVAIAGGSFAQGTLYYDATLGLVVIAKVGASYDLWLGDANGNGILKNPTGTTRAEFGSTVRFADGSVSVPVLSFVSDTDTGFYRIGADNIGLALGGANAVNYSTTGVAFAGVGPHSFGASTARAQFNIGGTFVAGSGGSGFGLRYAGNITPFNTNDAYGFDLEPTLQTGSGTAHNNFYSARFAAPAITLNAGGTVSVAATVAITSVPTGGTTNWALLQTSAGASLFSGDVVLGATVKLRVDGSQAGDSYVVESSANTVDVVAGGATTIRATATSAAITGTLSSTGDFAVNTNKFTVAASSGNTVVAGTLGATGNITGTAKVIVGTILDVGARTNALSVDGAALLLGNGVGGYTTEVGRLAVLEWATVATQLGVNTTPAASRQLHVKAVGAANTIALLDAPGDQNVTVSLETFTHDAAHPSTTSQTRTLSFVFDASDDTAPAGTIVGQLSTASTTRLLTVGYISLSTKSTGQASPTEKLRVTGAGDVAVTQSAKLYLDGVTAAGSRYVSYNGTNLQLVNNGAEFDVTAVGAQISQASGNKAALLFWDTNKAVYISATGGDPTAGGDYLNASGSSGVLIRAGGAYTASTEVARFTSGAAAVTGTLTATSHLGIAAGSKLQLDGVALSGDSYLTESSANVVDVVAGGTTTLRVNASGLTVTGTGSFSSNLTVGPGSTGTAITTLTINSGNGAGGEPELVLQRGGTRGGMLAVAGAANADAPGSVAGDFVVRAATNMLFTADDGSTLQGYLYGARGTWAFGNRSSVIATSAGAVGYFRHDFGSTWVGSDVNGVGASITGARTTNGTDVLRGLSGAVSIGGTSDAATNTGNWTKATAGQRGVESYLETRGGSSGTITGAAHFYANAYANNGACTITSTYVLYAEATTAGGTNWFVYNAGAMHSNFGTGDVVVGATAKARLDGSLAGDTYVTESSANVVDHVAGGTVSMTVSATGVTVGTLKVTSLVQMTTANTNLTVEGGTGAGSAGRVLLYGQSHATQPSDVEIYNGSSLAIKVTAGAVKFPLVGTTASAANAFLDNAASNNLLRSTSSLRYKKDLQPLDQLDSTVVLSALRPFTYRSLAPKDSSTRRFIGLGAEHVHAVDGRLVHYDGEGRPDGVMYDRVAVHLVVGWQEHEERLRRVESREERLEKALRELLERNEQLQGRAELEQLLAA